MIILVVDDDENSRVLVKTILESHGHTVETANNGVQALQATCDIKPDLVISDLLMPQMDGFQLCRSIKENPQTSSIPVVLFSVTYTDIESKTLALEIGASKFISKADEPAGFINSINEVIEEYKSKGLEAETKPGLSRSELDQLYYRTLVSKLSKKVDELSEANNNLAESEERFRGIYEQSPIGIEIYNSEGILEEANNACLKIFGIDDIQEVKGFKLFDDPNLPVDALARLHKNKCVQFESTFSFDVVKSMQLYKTSRSGMCYLDVKINPIGPANKPVGYLVHVQEITDRKKVEQKMLRLNKELEQIVYVSSHDLRTPLVNIQGYSMELELSLKDLISCIKNNGIADNTKDRIETIYTDMTESLEFINSSNSKMNSLISGLLKLSRSGKVELLLETIEMNQLVTDLLKTFEYTIKTSDIRVDLKELPPCKGDKNMISQVFSNLLSNALKYLVTGKQGIVYISGHKKNGHAVYCIEDNGQGIPPKYQSNIFDLFNQLDPKVNGEGLGLTISKSILERLNGKIWLESEPGKGSKFFVSLPA